ncbi:MAG: hypothetical protein DRN71_05285 [Candidatus Nanohalarchaeota archaeon]|nr:MAG: hypothetical protein DRN71_05285 [Candidatus Nanohaloarchaeota archaeon]
MKLCILGPKERTETEIQFLENAKKYFDKVLYVPMSNMRIESKNGQSIPYYKDTNLLGFDVILPRITRKYSDAGYVLVKLFEDNAKYIPVKYSSIVFGYNEFLTPIYLSEHGIPMPHTYFALSRVALDRILPTLKYPALLKLPYEKRGRMIIDSESSAKGIIDTIQQFGQPIIIQEMIENSIGLSILVVSDKMYALKNKDKVYRLNEKDREVVSNVVRVLGTSICQINALKTSSGLMILGVDICPNIVGFSEKFNEDMTEVILKHLKERTEMHGEKNIVTRFLKWIDLGMPK